MFKHNVLRVTAAITIFAGTIVGGAVQALAAQPRDEGLGRSGLWPRTAAVAAPTGFDGIGTPVVWALVVLVALAVVAAASLLSSHSWRRSHTHQPA